MAHADDGAAGHRGGTALERERRPRRRSPGRRILARTGPDPELEGWRSTSPALPSSSLDASDTHRPSRRGSARACTDARARSTPPRTGDDPFITAIRRNDPRTVSPYHGHRQRTDLGLVGDPDRRRHDPLGRPRSSNRATLLRASGAPIFGRAIQAAFELRRFRPLLTDHLHERSGGIDFGVTLFRGGLRYSGRILSIGSATTAYFSPPGPAHLQSDSSTVTATLWRKVKRPSS